MINYYLFHIKRILNSERGEFGIGAILSIAMALLIAAFVVFPGVKTFAGTIVTDMTSWWSSTIKPEIFGTGI